MALLILAVGLFFSFMIADFNDAPGVVIIGGALSLVASVFICGIGEVIVLLKQNNTVLTEMKDKLSKK